MAKTLLQAVNETLKRVRVISGDSGVLTTLTDSARQGAIDIAVQVINEGLEELYSVVSMALPKQQAQSTVTLVTSQRDYTLASNLIALRWPLIDKTNNQIITEFPGGYNAILTYDREQDDTGLPQSAAISPVDGKLYLDSIPTSAEAGRIYTYQYDKDLSLVDAADEFPFSDTAFRAMVPVWVQLWKREEQNQFDGDLFKASMGRAARSLPMKPPRSTYAPR